MTHTVKVIAGTALIIGIVINFFERLYPPMYLIAEQSPDFPSGLGWLGWALAALATFVYVSVDLIEWWRKK